MKGEIVSIVTEDWVRLHGLFCRSSERQVTGLDSAVLTHGLGGNFYKSRLLHFFAGELLKLGISVVLINTRGHDFLNSTPRQGRTRTIGAAMEVVSEGQFDVAAWANWLGEQGFSSVLQFGHSLGAIKALFGQAHHPQPIVKSIVGLSATRLSHRRLLDSARGERFQHWFSAASQMIEAGQGDQLIHVDFPFPTWMTAEGYVAKYGPNDDYNWLKFADRINVPTLLLFGEKEMNENPAFSGLEQELAAVVTENPCLDFKLVEGADHFYTARMDAAAEAMTAWLTAVGE